MSLRALLSRIEPVDERAPAGRERATGWTLASCARGGSGIGAMVSSTRKAARAIGWGASLVFALLVLGSVLVLLRADAGVGHTDEWAVLAGALGVALVGVIVIVYGLVQLARARRENDQREAT